MATVGRPIREGFDYFPLNTDFFKDRHVRRLVKKFGADGVVVLIYLWCECYGDKGYYLNLDEPIAEDVADDLMLEEDRVSEIIGYLIDKKWFVKKTSSAGESVLTSTGIQKRYLSIRNQIRRKLSGIVDPTIWMIEDISSETNGISSETNGISSETNGISSETNGISSAFSRNSSAFSHISSDEQKRTEQNRREVNKREQKKTESKRNASDTSDSSDSFHSSFSDLGMFGDPLYLSRALEEACGGKLPKNTQRKMGEWLRNYDHRSIGEAYNLAVAKGAHSIVGYMDTVLRKWSIGDGSPKWIEQEEMELKKEKDGHMQPGKTKEIMEMAEVVRSG